MKAKTNNDSEVVGNPIPPLSGSCAIPAQEKSSRAMYEWVIRDLVEVCDRLMGDSDLPDDNSFEMQAMQRAAALLKDKTDEDPKVEGNQILPPGWSCYSPENPYSHIIMREITDFSRRYIMEKESREKEWRESIEKRLDRIEDYMNLILSDIENVP